METSKHTEGEWKVEAKNLIKCNGEQIGSANSMLDEYEANAKLMASSKKLLEILIKITKVKDIKDFRIPENGGTISCYQIPYHLIDDAASLIHNINNLNSERTTRYLRLVNYETAEKVIKFINENDKNDWANITSGGVSMNVSDNNWNKVEDYIKSLNCRYEVCFTHPEEVNKIIVRDLKKKGVI